MEISMRMQAITFLLSFGLGVVFGVLYDVVRFLRVAFAVDVRSPFRKGGAKEKNSGRENAAVKKATGRRAFAYVFVTVSDFCFFAVCTVLMCCFYFVTSDGVVRSFALVGAFLGFLIYYNTVGALFISICSWLAEMLRRALRFSARLIWKGVMYAVRPIRKLLCATGRVFAKIANPIVIKAKARYNISKEKRVENARRAAIRRRMEKCGDVCRNNYNGSEVYEKR